MPGRWTCVNDHPVTGDHTHCPTCGGDVTWRQDPPDLPPRSTPAERRAHHAPSGPQSGWGLIVGGLALGSLGGLLLVAGLDSDEGLLVAAGWLVIALGGSVNLIGVIAEGVRLGVGLARREGRNPGDTRPE